MLLDLFFPSAAEDYSHYAMNSIQCFSVKITDHAMHIKDYTMGGEDVIISGHIKFANDPPKDPLPKPSLLVVKLQDCRRADCSAIDIGEVEVDAHSMYGDGGSLGYSMRVKNFIYDMDYKVSLCLWLSEMRYRF